MNQLQSSFNNGEISPLLYSRSDLAKFASSVKTAKNMIVHPQGGISKRCGTLHIGQLAYLGTNCRLLPFVSGESDGNILMCTPNNLYVFDRAGAIELDGSQVRLGMPFSGLTDLEKIKMAQSADVAYIAWGGKPKTLTRSSSTSWAFADYVNANGPLAIEDNVSMYLYQDTVDSVTKYRLKKTGYDFTGTVGKKFHLECYIDAQSFARLLNSDSDKTDLLANVFYTPSGFTVQTSGTWSGYFKIQTSVDGINNWRDIEKFTSDTGTANYSYTGDLTDEDAQFMRINAAGAAVNPDDGKCLNITVKSNKTLIYKVIEITEVLTDTSEAYIEFVPSDDSAIWPYIQKDGGTSPLVHIRPFLWWDNVFPNDVEIYQDRIIWATGAILDATKISDYTNFNTHTDIQDDDAIQEIIKEKELNSISALAVGPKLAVFTGRNNFIHTDNEFTPSSATFYPQGKNGASKVKPICIGSDIIYVMPSGKDIYTYGYSLEKDSYDGDSIAVLASHLFEGETVKEICYQRAPISLIWVLFESGKLICCNYLPQQNVTAWTEMELFGDVKSMCVVPNNGEDELFLAVAPDAYTLELVRLINKSFATALTDSFYVDDGIIYDGVATQTISGLSHLEGKSVVALADGNVVTGLTVSSGSVTLPTAASKVSIGLAYESLLETLPLDTTVGMGNTVNYPKYISGINISYYLSRSGYLSVNDGAERELITRAPSDENNAIPLKTGTQRIVVPTSYNKEVRMKIRHDGPLPITITALMPEVNYSSK